MKPLLAGFGSARGPLVRLSPGARIGAAAGLCLALTLFPITGWGSGLLYALAVFAHTLLAGMPWRRFLSLLFFASVAYAPLATAFSLHHLARGVAFVIVVANTLATLTFAEFHAVANALPIPALFRLLFIQILQQTALLWDQTGQIIQAIRLRGGNSRSRLLLLRTLPLVWIPRIVNRSERVAEAMEVRGYITGMTSAEGVK